MRRRGSARLEQVGAALEDGLGLERGDLELPALCALVDVLGSLLGVSVGAGCLDRRPGVLALLAQPDGDGKASVGLDLGGADITCRRGRGRLRTSSRSMLPAARAIASMPAPSFSFLPSGMPTSAYLVASPVSRAMTSGSSPGISIVTLAVLAAGRSRTLACTQSFTFTARSRSALLSQVCASPGLRTYVPLLLPPNAS